MGDPRPGGATPDDSGSHGLPDFPAEWGLVVIPDDAAELDDDAMALHRERRRRARQNRRRALLGQPPLGSGSGHAPGSGERSGQSILMPLAIMSIAVLVTLVSLFVVTWGRDASTSVGVPTSNSSTTTVSAAPATDLVDIALTDTVGAPARLRTFLPAIVLLVDGCDCDQLVADLAATAPAKVSVVVVGHTMPQLPATPPNVRPLADPTGAITGRYAGSAVKGTATAVLLDGPGSITAAVSGVDAATDLTPDQLSRLTAR